LKSASLVSFIGQQNLKKQRSYSELIKCAISVVSKKIAEGEGPFIESEYVNYLLAVTVDLCPDKQRYFPIQLLCSNLYMVYTGTGKTLFGGKHIGLLMHSYG
jgi:hypothetical protein